MGYSPQGREESDTTERTHTHTHTHTQDKVKFVACCFYEVGFLILSDEIYFMFLD